ncbi:MAG TPA: ABC transporter ATP-binding protein [bacterium]|nr:ABC transporter ATP-binding protein [bacterium]
MPLFELQNLSFRYPEGAFGLESLDLKVEPGGRVGLLGPNGAGKSTLLRLMAGLLRPAGGRVLLDGRPLDSIPVRDRARRVAFLPQSVQFHFPLSVLEIVRMGRHPYLGRFEPFSARDRGICDRALKLCDALDFRNRLFGELSGGEKQRVLLASALAQTPQVLLLDEPTLSLDWAHQLMFFDILLKLHREEGLGLVVATHEINLAGRYLGRILLMRDGRVLADGPPKKAITPKLLRRSHGLEVRVLPVKGEFPYFAPKKAVRP